MTYIYERVTPYDMVDRARAFDRLDQLGGPAGIRALHEHLEALAEDLGEPVELDIIALCCDWSHYDSALEAAVDYGVDVELILEDHKNGAIDDDERDEALLELLQDRTTVLDLDDGSVLVETF